MPSEGGGLSEELKVELIEATLVDRLKDALRHVVRCTAPGCSECAKAYELSR